jgi:hypothetical protein
MSVASLPACSGVRFANIFAVSSFSSVMMSPHLEVFCVRDHLPEYLGVPLINGAEARNAVGPLNAAWTNGVLNAVEIQANAKFAGLVIALKNASNPVSPILLQWRDVVVRKFRHAHHDTARPDVRHVP